MLMGESLSWVSSYRVKVFGPRKNLTPLKISIKLIRKFIFPPLQDFDAFEENQQLVLFRSSCSIVNLLHPGTINPLRCRACLDWLHGENS